MPVTGKVYDGGDRSFFADVGRICLKGYKGEKLNGSERKVLEHVLNFEKLADPETHGYTWIKTKTELAKQLGVSRPTIVDKHKRDGFPPETRFGWALELCQQWFAVQKAKITEDIPEASMEGVERGADHTLKRLEEEEVRVYSQRQAAMEGGNLELAEKLNGIWLDVSKRLKEFEVIVEKDKRDAGEVLPRKVHEDFAYHAAIGLRVGYSSAVTTLAIELSEEESPQVVKRILIEKVGGRMIESLNDAVLEFATIRLKPQPKSAETPMLEPWLVDAFYKGLGQEMPELPKPKKKAAKKKSAKAK